MSEIYFKENLATLRKRAALSQEALAEQLNISRQSVSKWESGDAFPEMKQLLELCKFFDVTMDALVHSKIASENPENPDLRAKYLKITTRHSRFISTGVGLILFGVTILLFLLSPLSALQPENTFAIIPLLVAVAFAVPFFIVSNDAFDHFKKKHPALPADFFSEDETESARQKYNLITAFSIAGIILGVATMLALCAYGVSGTLATAILLGFITVAVPCLVFAGIRKDAYNLAKYNQENSPETVKMDQKIGGFSGALMLIATIIYLCFGFIAHAWSTVWIVFPIFGILCALVAAVYHLIKER